MPFVVSEKNRDAIIFSQSNGTNQSKAAAQWMVTGGASLIATGAGVAGEKN